MQNSTMYQNIKTSSVFILKASNRSKIYAEKDTTPSIGSQIKTDLDIMFDKSVHCTIKCTKFL